MPPRLSLSPLARQLQALVPATRASISSTTRNAAVKDLGGVNASRDLLNFSDDDERSSGTTTDKSQAVDQADGAARLSRMLYKKQAWENISRKKETMEEMSRAETQRDELAQHNTRRWKPGDVYSPHDMSPAEMRKWKAPRRPSRDILDVLGLNPLDHYKNFSIISEFMTDMGRIKHSNDTGLRPVNQRKIAKAIRRAIGLGIHPSTHKHPMILFGGPRSGDGPRYQPPRNKTTEQNS